MDQLVTRIMVLSIVVLVLDTCASRFFSFHHTIRTLTELYFIQNYSSSSSSSSSIIIDVYRLNRYNTKQNNIIFRSYAVVVGVNVIINIIIAKSLPFDDEIQIYMKQEQHEHTFLNIQYPNTDAFSFCCFVLSQSFLSMFYMLIIIIIIIIIIHSVIHSFLTLITN